MIIPPLCAPSPKQARWTSDQIEQLKVRYPNQNAVEIADALGIRFEQVIRKSKALGLSHRHVRQEHGMNEPKPRQSKVAAAIMLMEANGGSATNEDLRIVMDLQPGQYPASWLGDAIKRGRVHKTDGGFGLGPGKGPTISSSSKKRTKPNDRIDAGDDSPSLPEDIAPQNTTPTFACALWSDGELSLVRDGENIATLSKSEFVILSEFIGAIQR